MTECESIDERLSAIEGERATLQAGLQSLRTEQHGLEQRRRDAVFREQAAAIVWPEGDLTISERLTVVLTHMSPLSPSYATALLSWDHARPFVTRQVVAATLYKRSLFEGMGDGRYRLVTP